jgi:tetratricopeptide (TPR) repeat protein
MTRAISRPALRAVIAVLAAASLVAAARAEDDPPKEAPAGDAKPQEPEKSPLPFETSWAAARAKAKERGMFVLAYVAQDNPESERCRMLEKKLFGDPQASDIASKCVLVRLRGADDITTEVLEFNRRYGVEAYPALYILNADGHLIVPSMAYTVESVLKALEFAATDERDFREMDKDPAVAARARTRELRERRMAWDDLLPAYVDESVRFCSPTTLTRLAEAYRRLSRPAEERATLAKAIEVFEETPERTRWRIRLATISLDEIAGKRDDFHEATIERLTPLAKQFAGERDKASEAEVRMCMGLAHAELHHCAEAKTEFDAVVDLAPKLPIAPKALLSKSAVHWYEYDYAGCKAACERILREYPKSPEAKPARRTIQSCDERTAGGGK